MMMIKYRQADSMACSVMTEARAGLRISYDLTGLTCTGEGREGGEGGDGGEGEIEEMERLRRWRD